MKTGELMKSQALIMNALATASLTALALLLPRLNQPDPNPAANLPGQPDPAGRKRVGSLCVSMLLCSFFACFANSYFYSVAIGNYFPVSQSASQVTAKTDATGRDDGQLKDSQDRGAEVIERKGYVLLCLPAMMLASIVVFLITALGMLMHYFVFQSIIILLLRIFCVTSAAAIVGFAGTLSDAIVPNGNGSVLWHAALAAFGLAASWALYVDSPTVDRPLKGKAVWSRFKYFRLLQLLSSARHRAQSLLRIHRIWRDHENAPMSIMLVMCAVTAVSQEVISQGDFYNSVHYAFAIAMMTLLSLVVASCFRILAVIKLPCEDPSQHPPQND